MIPKVLASTLVIINLLVTNLFAVNTVVTDQTNNQVQNLLSDLSVGQFIALDFDKMHESKSVKINWIQKSIFKAAQKKLAKKVANGKIDAADTLMKEDDTKGKNKIGMLSLIFGVTGLIFLILGQLGLVSLLALPFGITALILGIRGVKKDKNRTMAFLGLVFGYFVIGAFLLYSVLLAAYA